MSLELYEWQYNSSCHCKWFYCMTIQPNVGSLVDVTFEEYTNAMNTHLPHEEARI